MRWITFVILLYLMTALQVTRFGAIPSGGPTSPQWPAIEYLPLLAIFYALFAAESAAPLAALACGALYDVFTAQYLGMHAVPLALVAWCIVRIRLLIFREHMISQVVMTLLGVLLFAALSVILRWLTGGPLEGRSVWTHLGYLAGDAVYTALAAPILFHLFFRFRGMLGFSAQGPRSRGHMR